MNNTLREKYLKMALVAFGVIFCLVYPIGLVWPSGWVWHGGQGGEDALLASCYTESLKLASDHGVKTVAFPAISTGVYGYPIQLAAGVALQTVWSQLEQQAGLELVRFVLFSDADLAVFQSALDEVSQRMGG